MISNLCHRKNLAWKHRSRQPWPNLHGRYQVSMWQVTVGWMTCLSLFFIKNMCYLQSRTKVLGTTVMQYSCFSAILGSLMKQCILFEMFLQFFFPPPYTKSTVWKNSGYTSQHCSGVRGGVGPVWIRKRPEKLVSQDWCNKHCSLVSFL